MENRTKVDYKYKVAEVESGSWTAETRPEAIEDVLNQETKGEWEHVETVTTGPNNKVKVIFRKPV